MQGRTGRFSAAYPSVCVCVCVRECACVCAVCVHVCVCVRAHVFMQPLHASRGGCCTALSLYTLAGRVLMQCPICMQVCVMQYALLVLIQCTLSSYACRGVCCTELSPYTHAGRVLMLCWPSII